MAKQIDDIEQQLAELAERERQHSAPAELRLSIKQQVHQAMRQAPANSLTDSFVERGIEWCVSHLWHALPLGAAAVAVPVFTGAMLGYQLEDVAYDVDSPAAEWISSYSSEDGELIIDAGTVTDE